MTFVAAPRSGVTAYDHRRASGGADYRRADPPRRRRHRHPDRRERHGRRGHADRRLDRRRGDQRARRIAPRPTGRSGQSCAEPTERRIGRTDDGGFRCRRRRGRRLSRASPSPEAEHAKSARLDAPFRRVPFPRARFAAMHADEGAQGRGDAGIGGVAETSAHRRRPRAAPPSGYVAAAFDLFDPQPTVAAGASCHAAGRAAAAAGARRRTNQRGAVTGAAGR